MTFHYSELTTKSTSKLYKNINNDRKDQTSLIVSLHVLPMNLFLLYLRCSYLLKGKIITPVILYTQKPMLLLF